jgi:hypothetical protein
MEKFFRTIVQLFLDKIYDENAAFEQAADEAKRIQAVEKRNKQVRQLFHKQTTANRTKVYFPLLFFI